MAYSDNNNAIFKINFGDHVCSIYQNKEQQFKSVIPFIMDGLNGNEKCIYIVDDNSKEMVLSEFEKVGNILDKYIKSGQFEFFTKDETYTKGGRFDSNNMLVLTEELEKKAVEEGYDGARGTAEMTWMLDAPINIDNYIKYESGLNESLVGHKYIALCQYNENKFSQKILNNVIRTHPFTIIYGKMYKNKYFYTAPEYMEEGSNMLPEEDYQTIIETIKTE